jgi:hypothetical protein
MPPAPAGPRFVDDGVSMTRVLEGHGVAVAVNLVHCGAGCQFTCNWPMSVFPAEGNIGNMLSMTQKPLASAAETESIAAEIAASQAREWPGGRQFDGIHHPVSGYDPFHESSSLKWSWL